MKSEIDTAKEWLLRYSEINKTIDNLILRSDLLKDKASAPSSAKIDGMPHGKGGNTDKIGTLIAKYEELDTEAREKIAESRTIYREINDVIKNIQGRGSADLRVVLQLKYLDLANWNEIVFLLFGNEPDFAEREDSFIRRTFKLHSRALTIIKDLIPENSLTGNEG